MSKPLYRIVLRDAWRTTWRHRRLWVWGLFAGLLGNAGEYQFLITATDRIANRQPFSEWATALLQMPPVTSRTLQGLWLAMTTEPFSTLIILTIGLVIIGSAALFIWLTMTSVIALVQGAAAVADGDGVPSLAAGVAAGHRLFAPVLVIYLFGKLLLWFLLTLLVLLGALALYDAFVGLPLFVVAFVIVVPALFTVSFVVRYAMMAAVLRGSTLLESIDWAIALFRQHWLITVELAFLLFAVNVAVGIALVSLISLFVIPLLVGAFAVWQLGFATWATLLIVLAIILFLVFLLTMGSALGTFQWAAWTNLYLKLHERGHLSKLARFFNAVVVRRTATPRQA